VTNATDFERAFALQRWVLETSSTRTVDLPWGTAFFHDEFPLKYDANLALLDRPLGTSSVESVDEVMEDLYAGFRHREIEVRSDEDADRLAMGLAERGYAVESLVVMAHRRDPDREPGVGQVDEVDAATIRDLHMEITRRESWGKEPGIAEIMVAHRDALGASIGARIFAQRVDGHLAGSCELYLHGDVAQIEDVGTLEEFRGRGVARNVVLRAADEARSAGASLVFLFADGNDWPQHLYARLGFDVLGPSRLFMRTPEGERPDPAKSQDA
jgi:ribosomal protein S18 acetylase RimI-like enzyme